ncbi:MAG: hypothetical protein ACR2RE_22645 [Geminicoccaceae bacterium]
MDGGYSTDWHAKKPGTTAGAVADEIMELGQRRRPSRYDIAGGIAIFLAEYAFIASEKNGKNPEAFIDDVAKIAKKLVRMKALNPRD